MWEEKVQKKRPRSLKKGPFAELSLQKKADAAIANKDKKPIKTCSRRSLIIPSMVGLTISVHNGRHHVPVFINEAAYSEKNIAMILTKKEALAFNPSWGKQLYELVSM